MERINVLGTEYFVETHKVSEDSYLKENNLAGYCDEAEKLIVVADMSEKGFFELDEKAQKLYRRKTLRHEVIHAFLNESGLSNNSLSPDSWAKNEEMIDWFAIQSPKIFAIFTQLHIL